MHVQLSDLLDESDTLSDFELRRHLQTLKRPAAVRNAPLVADNGPEFSSEPMAGARAILVSAALGVGMTAAIVAAVMLI